MHNIVVIILAVALIVGIGYYIPQLTAPWKNIAIVAVIIIMVAILLHLLGIAI